MEYIVVTECNPELLGEHVNKNCQEGWIPSGSMSIVIDPDQTYYFFQPMIKRKDISL